MGCNYRRLVAWVLLSVIVIDLVQVSLMRLFIGTSRLMRNMSVMRSCSLFGETHRYCIVFVNGCVMMNHDDAKRRFLNSSFLFF